MTNATCHYCGHENGWHYGGGSCRPNNLDGCSCKVFVPKETAREPDTKDCQCYTHCQSWWGCNRQKDTVTIAISREDVKLLLIEDPSDQPWGIERACYEARDRHDDALRAALGEDGQ